MPRMMRRNFHRQPGRVEGHGDCAICKPNDWKGRSEEKREWEKEVENDVQDLRGGET